MIKRLDISNLTSKAHEFGRSYKVDFPIEAIEGYVVGVYACPSNINVKVTTPDGELNPKVNELSGSFSTFGKVSVSTDNGDVIHSSVPIMVQPALGIINKLMVPVDYHGVGNKLTIVLEEFIERIGDEEAQISLSYDLAIYVRLSKRASDVTDINQNRKRAVR